MNTTTTTPTSKVSSTPGARRETIFQKQKRLEGYLLNHPNSALFAWYGRQNMEIGKLDRAEKICQLGLKGDADPIILHKLLGDIYLAQGKTDAAREEYAIVLQSHRPFPGVIQAYLKNWKTELSTQEETALMRRLSFIIPGNAEVVKYFKLQSDVDRILTRPDRRDFLPESANNPASTEVQESAEMEPVDEMAAAQQVTGVKTEPTKPAPTNKSESKIESPKKAADKKPAAKIEADSVKTEVTPIAEISVPDDETPLLAPNHKIRIQPTPEQEDGKPQKITRSMATFTLMQIFKDQGLYQHALEVLEILREKSPNTERVEAEIEEIKILMTQQANENQA